MAEDSRADYGEIPGTVRGPKEEPRRQRGSLSVQEYLSTGQLLIRLDNVYNYYLYVSVDPYNNY